MADIKISQLTTAAKPLSGQEIVVMNQNGTTVSSPLSTIKTYTDGTSLNIGVNNRNTGSYSSVVGLSSLASGTSSMAFGVSLSSTGKYSSTMGYKNTASGCYSNVAGGRCNTACGCYSNVAGGACNVTNACFSHIAGGASNTIHLSASYSSILAGSGITALSANTAYAPTLNLTAVPTLSDGLVKGFIWNQNGFLRIVP